MIIAAAVCPHPPLLLRELTGWHDVVGELRQSCLRAVRDLVELSPDVIVVVGGAESTAVRLTAGELNVRGYGTFAARSGASLNHLPLSLGIAKGLLAEVHWRGDTEWLAVARNADRSVCADLGRELAGRSGRLGLLVMADGSACRSEKAPGYIDDRAHVFDKHVTQALAAGDSRTLLELDAELAEQLLMQGRASLQLLGSAVHHAGNVPAAQLRYLDDPFGVLYFVSFWTMTNSGIS